MKHRVLTLLLLLTPALTIYGFGKPPAVIPVEVVDYDHNTDAQLAQAVAGEWPEMPTRNYVTLWKGDVPSAIAAWVSNQIGDHAFPAVELYVQDADVPSQYLLVLGALTKLSERYPGIAHVALRKSADEDTHGKLMAMLLKKGLLEADESSLPIPVPGSVVLGNIAQAVQEQE